MMNQALKNHRVNFTRGMILKGKWHHKRYVIRKKLGSGAIGSVYLCEWDNKLVALKISEKRTSMMREVNVLKALSKVQGKKLGPSLLDVDDWESEDSKQYTFYAMEYLRGESLASFIHKNGHEWIGVFMLQLLDDLGALHEAGWVFGDFKTENLLVVSSPTRVRWIDVGGTTQIGRAIKEYTAFYDRAYWNLGSRRAEASYDLFALVMTILDVYYPKRFPKGSHPEQTILKKIYTVKALRIYYKPFRKAVQGKYTSSGQMKDDIKYLLYQVQNKSKKSNYTASSNPVLIESAGIFVLSFVYYAMYVLL